MLGISTTAPNQAELQAELKAGIQGDVRLDRMSRGLYSTDASIYQIEPIAVVAPRDARDVAHALAVARRRGLKVLPRGGGTSLAGQAAGRALVIDFSQYMNRILTVNEAERWVRVEPGIVRDELNAQLASTGLHFAPETATSNRANVGGMVGNNSSGTRSIVYGKTIDHVLELTVMLPTGETLKLAERTAEEWDAIAERDDREGRLYASVRAVIEANHQEIRARYPKVMRRVGGYNLDAFLDERVWNMAHLIVGSEGTLATVLEAKLRLTPNPRATGVCVVHFRKMKEALRAVSAIVGHGPSAVEVLDETVLTMARQNLEIRRICDWIVESPAAVLIVEFFADSPDEIEVKIDGLVHDLESIGFGCAYPRMLDAASQRRVWQLRASGLGLMLGIKGDAKPTAFIEDAAVPVDVLHEYIAEVLGVCKELEVPVAMYAHASVGLIHVRPILDLKQPGDIEKMKKISEGAFALVQKYGGSWSGEHGDGLVRSYMNERFFGERLYAAFKEVKRLFDPETMMNPGKIVDAGPMDENLRLGPQYRATLPRTHYHFREAGGFDRAVELCTGVGACRKTLGGTMCPSYMATRDEAHSTRGRANALRLAMTGQLGFDGMTSREVFDVMDLCLGCKGCKAECPSNVDLARLKGEFLAGYHAKRGATMGEKLFARAPRTAARIAGRMSGRLAGAANAIGRFAPARAAMEKLFGLDRRRPLPEFAREGFSSLFDRRLKRTRDGGGRRVVLFDDTFTNYHEPRLGLAAVDLLERLGYRVELARAGCCGRPLISHGFLAEAAAEGLATMRRLNRFALEEAPILFLEPSCLSAVTDDLVDLIEDAKLGRRVAEACLSIEDFLARELDAERIDASALPPEARAGAEPPRFLIHGHCHQKALYGTSGLKRVLGAIEGAKVEEIDSGCCGMAGSFGYERAHYELSMQIGERRLFPAARGMDEGTRLIACGFSCRHQIADATAVRARHFVEALAEA